MDKIKDPEIYKNNKPVLDYRVVIRNLENDIVLMNQHYNDTKQLNEKKMRDLDEIRKNILFNRNKLDFLNNTLKEQEEEYFDQKKNIEAQMKGNK